MADEADRIHCQHVADTNTLAQVAGSEIKILGYFLINDEYVLEIKGLELLKKGLGLGSINAELIYYNEAVLADELQKECS